MFPLILLLACCTRTVSCFTFLSSLASGHFLSYCCLHVVLILCHVSLFLARWQVATSYHIVACMLYLYCVMFHFLSSLASGHFLSYCCLHVVLILRHVLLFVARWQVALLIILLLACCTYTVSRFTFLSSLASGHFLSYCCLRVVLILCHVLLFLARWQVATSYHIVACMLYLYCVTFYFS